MTLQLPADDDVNDVPLKMEQPAVPASDTLYEYPPVPVPPEADSEIFELKVPFVDVNEIADWLAFTIVTVVAPELAIK